ncbi:MAG: hypothetical protein JWQ90_2177 [Hydrocarboniphaga sp.]|uniref:hypothetical protein n=1 Tax=Hydrocarboniphaga sp. TaxID=2033016 RepID=UPI002618EC00|nr:hypothetical protein [Hydrocarboniphaga sp.]MDB5969727.1 hypothetical protein [Hydrocarboniphaga sp.]
MNLFSSRPRGRSKAWGAAALSTASACFTAASLLASTTATAAPPVAASALLGNVLNTTSGIVQSTVSSAKSLLSTRDDASAATGGVAPPAINKYTGGQIANGAVLLLWTGDGCASPLCNPKTAQDFLAVVDAEPNSTTYGNVIWTAELPNVLASNVAGNILGALGSDSHNDPHHMLSYTSYISDGSDGLSAGRKYTFAGGVISKNVFRYDITSVRGIRQAEIAVCGTQVRRSSLTDDFVVMPSNTGGHKIMYTYMSNYVYGPGGTVTEIDPSRTAPTALGGCLPAVPAPVALLENAKQFGLIANLGAPPDDTALLGHVGITEYPGSVRANQPRNPTEYTSSPDTRQTRTANQGLFFLGNKDAGLESVPHGMGLTYDGKYLATSDYAVAASIGGAAINGALGELCGSAANGGTGTGIGPLGICGSSFGSSVRVWETSGEYTHGKTTDSLKQAGVYDGNKYLRSVSAVPDGPRQEPILIHEENEGLMAFGLPHQSHHCVDQKGWVNKGDPSYDKAVTPAGVAANASGKSPNSCSEGDADYVPHKGAFSASMCGGVLFYSPDISIRGDEANVFGGKGPYWRAVYDVGPCSGVSYFTIADDDRFLVLPVSGIESPKSIDAAGSIDFDRDYPREHSRRVLTVDIRPLLAKGTASTATTSIACDFPEADASRTANTTLGTAAKRADLSGGVSAAFNVLHHNNEADDCPRVRGAIGQFETGPNGVGLATTASSNTSQPGVGYIRLAEAVTEVRALTPLGIIVTDEHAGGEPSGTGGAPGSGNLNSLQNLYTHGGPHFTNIDRVGYEATPAGEGGYKDLRPSASGTPRNQVIGQSQVSGTDRFVFIQYFVELNHVPLPGTGSDGDRTVCLGKLDRTTGATVLDTSFTDELLGTPCLDFDSAARDAWLWPGERGVKGGAKPHSAIFERDGAPLFGPGYFPAAPLDPDGAL